MTFFNETGILTNEKISEWSEMCSVLYLRYAGKRAVSESKVQISVEELLLKFRESYGTHTVCHLKGRKTRDRITFEFTQSGPQIDPVAVEDDMLLPYDILSRLGVYPSYYYYNRRKINCVTFSAELKPVKNKMLIQILSMLALAIALRFVLGAAAPELMNSFYTGITKPVFSKLIAVITALATPLVFLAVISGITGLGDAATFSKIGTKTCGAMGITYLIAALILSLCVGIGYPPDFHAAAADGNVLEQIVTLVLDIIPNNILQPFTTDNDLQVITIAVFMGVIMLLLGNRLHILNNLIQDATSLVNKMMTTVCKLLPLVVFLGIYNLLCSTNLSDFISIYKVLILFAIGCMVMIGIMILRVALATKVPFSILFRKMLPTLMINLTTSSQVAALPENMICCKEKFGINEKMIDFALPLGIVVFMPCGAIFIGLLAASLAAVSGVALTLTTMIKLVFVSVILAIAAPPIPGSALAIMPIVFASCGIPDSVFPIAVVIGTILGYILPAFNGFLLQLQLLLVAVKTNKVDMDKLRTPVSEG